MSVNADSPAEQAGLFSYRPVITFADVLKIQELCIRVQWTKLTVNDSMVRFTEGNRVIESTGILHEYEDREENECAKQSYCRQAGETSPCNG